MSFEDENALKNASAIIERFGGIRPMAAKVGAPVTTVQGWKKRDVIPAARRDDVLKAANENSIDLADLIEEEGAPAKPVADVADRIVAFMPEKTHKLAEPVYAPANNDDRPDVAEPAVRPAAASAPLPQSITPRIDTTHEELMAMIERTRKKAISSSVWTGGIFTLLVVGAAFIALMPTAQKIEQQSQDIAALEGKVYDMSEEAKDNSTTLDLLKDMMPDGMEKQISDLKSQAKDLSKVVLASDAGSLSDRLSVVEAKLQGFDGAEGLKELTARIRGLEASMSGQNQLSASITELKAIVESLDGQVGTLDTKMADLQKNPNSALGKTVEGVTPEDLKAAAMLIAFSQLRDSLNRQEPFEEDVVLLQKLVGNDNQQLNEALSRLAPAAKEGGVLTSAGLSDEFKGLAGDIVFASLKGEDVSAMDKLKVRMTQALSVKKDGQIVGGTATQQTVAKAQSELDQGDIQGAIATLQTLDGASAQAAQPFIDQAQASLLADQVQVMLRQMITGTITMPSAATTGAMPVQAEGVLESLKEVGSQITGDGQVVRDEKSGFAILPAPKGFKGFSEGTSE